MNFLYIRDRTSYPIEKPRRFVNLQKYVRRDIAVVESYYSTGAFFVNNSNFFVTLIKRLMNDEDDPIRALDLLEIDYDHKLRATGVVTNNSPGKVLGNVFGDSLTIINMDIIPPLSAFFDDNAKVTKVLYTNYTDLCLNHPAKIRTGDFVIGLDVRALMMQYLKYRLENSTASIQTFVFQILYTNMVAELFDWSVFNRLNNPLCPPSESKHVFSVGDYDEDVLKMNTELLEKVSNTGKYYSELLFNIPSVTNESMYDTMFIPTFNPNAQNNWVYFISVAYKFIQLARILGTNGIKKNRTSITELKWFFKIVDSNKLLSRKYPSEELDRVVNELRSEVKVLTERKTL